MKVQILQLLKRLIAELDMAIVLITHDLGIARALADKVGVVYAGQVVEMGPAAEVLNAPKYRTPKPGVTTDRLSVRRSLRPCGGCLQLATRAG